MLNEAYQVAKSLERAGIVPDATSGDVKIPGASSGTRGFVRLRKGGGITGISAVEKDDEAGLWTIMEGNHNSFPVVRFKRPLIIFPADHPIWPLLAAAGRSKTPDEATKDVLLTHVDPELAETPDETLWLRLRDTKAPAVAARAGTAVPSVADLCARFIQATPDPKAFFKDLARVILDELRNGKVHLARYAREVLVGKEPTKSKAETSVQLAFDLDGGETIYRKERKIAMSAARPGDKQSSITSHCAYSGDCSDLLKDPFPKVRVPVLGFDYPLLSMFSEAGCNVRYGLTDERVIPISAATVMSAHGALSHLFGPENEDTVWRAVASGQLERKSGKTFDKKDLLVAYVGEGDAPVKSARIGGVPKGENYRTEVRSLIGALKGIAYANPSARLNLFVLRAVSKGQAQAVYAEQPLVSDVFEGASEWAAGQNDRPKTLIDSLTRPAPLVSPEDAVRVLSYVWKHDGTDAHRKTGILLGQAFDLLLLRPGRADDAAREMLSLIVARTTPLLRSVSTELRQGDPVGADRRFASLRILNLIGLCLHHFDISLDQTMNEPAYLVGRLLGLADKLHIQYCRVVRGGQIPPTLIGNALLGTALDNPVSALATLADRMRIYLGWAETSTKSGDEAKQKAIGIAHATLWQFSDVEVQLRGVTLATSCTDLMKAQMLLGYLARTKTDTDVPEIETKEETEYAK